MTELVTPQARMQEWVQTKPEQTFLFQPKDGKVIETNWQQFNTEVLRIASYLRKFPPGSRIGILSLNCDSWIKADLAILAAGHISVPIYPTAGSKTISQIIEHAEIELIFIGKLYESPDFLSNRERGKQPELIAMFQTWPALKHWDEILEAQKPLQNVFLPKGSDIATIVYTSGTTGAPKGVVINYQSISNAFASVTNTLNISNSERFFSYLPLAHVAERIAVEMAAIFYGCNISFVNSLDTFAKDIVRARPTVFFGVPRIWVKFKQTIESKLGGPKVFKLLTQVPFLGSWLKSALVKRLGLDKAWLCLSGAASISKETLNWFKNLGIQINEVYGMSESLGLATANTPENNKLGTVGSAVFGCEIIIAENGEVLIKTPSLMTGYYKAEDLTNACLQGEWFRTGDLGQIDDEGFLSITGRAKDLFKTSKGKYISPIPIEQSLSDQFESELTCVMGEGLSQPVAVVYLPNVRELMNDKDYTAKLIKRFEELNATLEKHERLDFIGITEQEWTPENELMTPTLKIRRQSLEAHFMPKIEVLLKSKSKSRLGFLDNT